MNTTELAPSLGLLMSELADGASPAGGFLLNRSDRGLLRSLDLLSADDASAIVSGGASIAAHADHLRYSLSLMNRWLAGENPWADADWKASWRRTAVTIEEWAVLRQALRDEITRWQTGIRQPRELQPIEATGMIGGVAHLAYHAGAMRQMNRAARGPSAEE